MSALESQVPDLPEPTPALALAPEPVRTSRLDRALVGVDRAMQIIGFLLMAGMLLGALRLLLTMLL